MNGKPSKAPMPRIVVPMYLCYRDVYHSIISTRETAALDKMWSLPAREPRS